MSSDKPRILQGGRDMILSLAVMGVLMFITVGFTGLCNFNPGKPENGPIPEADVATFLMQETRRVPYPVVAPEAPDGWTPNSVRSGMVGEHQTSTIGYVTSEDSYIQVLQTDAPADQLPDDGKDRTETGTIDAGGVTWRVLEGTGDNVRRAWVADLSDIRLEIQGSASDAMYRTLAEAAVTAQRAHKSATPEPGAPAPAAPASAG